MNNDEQEAVKEKTVRKKGMPVAQLANSPKQPVQEQELVIVQLGIELNNEDDVFDWDESLFSQVRASTATNAYGG